MVTSLDVSLSPAPEITVDLVAGAVDLTLSTETVELEVDFIGVPGPPGPGVVDVESRLTFLEENTVQVATPLDW